MMSELRFVILRATLALAIADVPGLAPAAAQFFNFGQNKIQYRKLEWRMLRGAARRSLLLSRRGRAGPRGARRTPRRATTRWRCSSATTSLARIPLIVYASHTDFEQTNILPFTPPEGLLGATDFLKRRVVAAVPGQLRRVPAHVAARDGARLPARSLHRELQPGPALEPVQLPALVERGAGRALVGRAGRAGRDGACATSR